MAAEWVPGETECSDARCGHSGTSQCGLYVFVSNSRLLIDLQFFLRRVGCAANQVDSHQLEVQVAEAPGEDQARREVELYLALWTGRKSLSGVQASILVEPRW
jgi:hypothetical protein